MTSGAAAVFSTGALNGSVNESRIPVFTQLSLGELLGGSVGRSVGSSGGHIRPKSHFKMGLHLVCVCMCVSVLLKVET